MTRHIPLTKGYVALVDDDRFDEVNQFKWCALVGARGIVYGQRRDGKKRAYLHRYLLGVTDRLVQVDHRNHDGLDNRIANLRTATVNQNQGNKRPAMGMSSVYKGVNLDRVNNRWMARIQVDGRQLYLGRHATELEAAAAYDAAALSYFGEFACLNLTTEAAA